MGEAIVEGEGAVFRVNLWHPIVTLGPFLCSCAEVCTAIELSFGVGSRVIQAFLYLMVHVPQGEGLDFGSFAPLAQWFQWRIM